MAPALTKTRTVLKRSGAPFESGQRYFAPAPPVEPGERVTTVSLDPDVWADMGEPDTITVTVEPGDALNE